MYTGDSDQEVNTEYFSMIDASIVTVPATTN